MRCTRRHRKGAPWALTVVMSALLLGVQVAEATAAVDAAQPKPPVNVPAQRAGGVPVDDEAEPTQTRAVRVKWPEAAPARITLSGLKPGASRPVVPAGGGDAAVRVSPAPLVSAARAPHLRPPLRRTSTSRCSTGPTWHGPAASAWVCG